MSIVPKVAAFLKENAPESVFRAAKFAYNKVIRANKTTDELNFWLMQHIRNGGKFENAHYERVMLEMARDIGREGLAGKTVCDFGCGPRGTLAWLADEAHCIGLDVLIPGYLAKFPEDLRQHGMTYVGCSETFIPIASDTIDVMYTLNALDHVNDLPLMCGELMRVIKPGGYLFGSFNLGEEQTITEPQTLDEEKLDRVLFHGFEELSRRTAAKFKDDVYGGFFGREMPDDYDGPMVLWFAGRRKDG